MWWLNLLTSIPSLLSKGFDFLNKKEDVSLKKYEQDGRVNIEAMRQDTAIIQARADLAKARKDDPTDRWGRRLFMYPTGLWFALIVYDSCFRTLLPHDWTWRVLALPQNVEYIPYAVIGYLFITAWKK